MLVDALSLNIILEPQVHLDGRTLEFSKTTDALCPPFPSERKCFSSLRMQFKDTNKYIRLTCIVMETTPTNKSFISSNKCHMHVLEYK